MRMTSREQLRGKAKTFLTKPMDAKDFDALVALGGTLGNGANDYGPTLGDRVLGLRLLKKALVTGGRYNAEIAEDKFEHCTRLYGTCKDYVIEFLSAFPQNLKENIRQLEDTDLPDVAGELRPAGQDRDSSG